MLSKNERTSEERGCTANQPMFEHHLLGILTLTTVILYR